MGAEIGGGGGNDVTGKKTNQTLQMRECVKESKEDKLHASYLIAYSVLLGKVLYIRSFKSSIPTSRTKLDRHHFHSLSDFSLFTHSHKQDCRYC